MEYQETWFRSRTIAQESEEKAVIFSFNTLLGEQLTGMLITLLRLTDVKELKRL